MVSHPGVVLGLERYLLATLRGVAMAPALFERERFFDARPNESVATDLADVPYYRRARKRFDDAAYVGDKQPALYRGLDGIEANFAGATVVCILRNIIDVAGSFQMRAENRHGQPWNPERDHARAVEDWRACLGAVAAFAARPDRRTRLVVVCYEDLFMQDAAIGTLFGALELDVPSPVVAEYAALRGKSPALEARRADGLTTRQREYVALHAPFDMYRRVHALRLDLSPPAPP